MGATLFRNKLPFWALLLSGIATLLTLNNYQLFGLQFTFGMSVALATLFLQRRLWGLVIAIPVAISTYILWGEPYAGIVYILEILLMTFIRNGPGGDRSLRRGTIVIYDFIFWTFLGAPIYYFTYAYLANYNQEAAFVIAQKSIVNGVMNTLIAYVIYAAVTIMGNRRSQNRESISIQALALATIYSVIVFLSLFMADRLYGTAINLKAKSLYQEMTNFAAFIFDDMDDRVPSKLDFTLENELKQKNADAIYQSEDGIQKILYNQGKIRHQNFPNDFKLETSRSRLSRNLYEVAEMDGASINLYLNNTVKQDKLNEYLNSLWEIELHKDGKTLILIKPARQDFDIIFKFAIGALPIINSTTMGGIILSIIIGYGLKREFLTVLGKSTKNKINTPTEEAYRSLEQSPITEIGGFAKEINRRTDDIKRAKEKIEELNNIAQQQLSTAGKIQQAFLGDSSDVGKQPDVSLFMRPALNAGGDWYDAFDLDNKTFIIVADVCDKGVGAALFMSVFRSLIRYAAENWCAEESEHEPLDEVISSVNNYMSTEHEVDTMFATVFIGCISHPAKRLDYVLAGHEEPIFINSKGVQQNLEVTGPAIGLFPEAEYTMKSLFFDEDSILVGYSDGVVDARCPEGTSYGYQRLLDLVQDMQKRKISAKNLKNEIVRDLDAHMKNAEQFDDITIATVIL